MHTTTIDALLDRYDTLLFDAYGVLVRAQGAVPGAPELIQRMREEGRPFFILTNDASRSIPRAAARYQELGLPIAPDQVITSGSLLSRYARENDLAGARALVLGVPDSLDYARDASLDLHLPHYDALTRDPYDVFVLAELPEPGLRDYLGAFLSGLLATLDAGHTPHLVLPNPDLFYPRDAHTYGITAGSAAAMFEQTLRERYGEDAPTFTRLGKPHPYIYEQGALLAGVPKDRMVMIGDQWATDVLGALRFGIDAALVTTGVITEQHLADAPKEAQPTWLLPNLSQP